MPRVADHDIGSHLRFPNDPSLFLAGDRTFRDPATGGGGGEAHPSLTEHDAMGLATTVDFDALRTGHTTFVVASSNTNDEWKEHADYVCDGVADQVEINAAIAALPSAGGTVELTEGTFTTTAKIAIEDKRVWLAGQGHAGTLIRTDSAIDMIEFYANVASIVGCGVRYLSLDGTNDATSGLLFKRSGASEFTQVILESVFCVGSAKNLNLTAPIRLLSLGGSYEYGTSPTGVYSDGGGDLIFINPWFEALTKGLDLHGDVVVTLIEPKFSGVTTRWTRTDVLGYRPIVVSFDQRSGTSPGYPTRGTASSSLTLTTTHTDITGASVTLPRDGAYHVTGVFDFERLGDDGMLEGKLVVGSGTATIGDASALALFGMPAGSRGTCVQHWVVTTATEGAVLKLQARKPSGTGASACYLTHTSLVAQ